jgi:hypothetical protein
MAFKMERVRTRTSPYVLIDEEKKYIRLEGESYLEDIVSFFEDIMNWLRVYLKTDFGELTFDFAMEYFNSSTTKQIYIMLRMMNEHAAGNKITVNWIVEDENDDMLIECGADYADEMENLTFNMLIGSE